MRGHGVPFTIEVGKSRQPGLGWRRREAKSTDEPTVAGGIFDLDGGVEAFAVARLLATAIIQIVCVLLGVGLLLEPADDMGAGTGRVELMPAKTFNVVARNRVGRGILNGVAALPLPARRVRNDGESHESISQLSR
jgi:hypothetical protein